MPKVKSSKEWFSIHETYERDLQNALGGLIDARFAEGFECVMEWVVNPILEAHPELAGELATLVGNARRKASMEEEESESD